MKENFTEKDHKYFLDGTEIPSVTQVLQEAGLINLEWVDKEVLKAKALFGTKVHKTTELYDKGTLDIAELHPTLSGYLNGWVKFRNDYDFIPTYIEIMLFHKLYKFAGRIDRVGCLGDDLALVDIKSGTKQKVSSIQTAGYELLYNQDKTKKDQIKKRYLVYLNKDNYKVEECKNINDKNIFLSALTITNYKRSVK